MKRVGLYHLQDCTAGKLSKGMLQRLGLAIALCGAPELLVLDEPFNGLDPALLETLEQILREDVGLVVGRLLHADTVEGVVGKVTRRGFDDRRQERARFVYARVTYAFK